MTIKEKLQNFIRGKAWINQEKIPWFHNFSLGFMKQLQCIMLVDDNADDNFYHERVIEKSKAANVVIAMQSATEALAYLKSRKSNKTPHPDLIFLDINMPGMNGWEFLVEYNKLDKQLQSRAIVVMLTTSENPDDKKRAMSLNIASDFKTKPLTGEMLREIISTHLKE